MTDIDAVALQTRLYATDDPQVWAEEFLKVAAAGAVVDFGLMVGWFANAMATAEHHAIKRRMTGPLCFCGEVLEQGTLRCSRYAR